MKQAELLKMVRGAYVKQVETAQSLKGSQNPQIKAAEMKCWERADILEAIAEAMQGNPVLLRSYSE